MRQILGACVVVMSLAMLLLGSLVVYECGKLEGRYEIQQEAIRRGYAEFVTTSGKWQWKVQTKKSPAESRQE
jgi:hypothetical protein